MNRIIIFRFHKSLEISENRLQLLKKLNPNIPIYGMFGGKEKELPEFKKHLKDYLENIFLIKDKPSEWKWKNYDIMLRDWYKETGSSLNFDIAHIIEWDLILCKSLEEIYSDVKENEVSITALTELPEIENKWMWTSKEPFKTDWLKLLSHVKEEYNYNQTPYGSLGPGTCLPRKFFEEYSKIDVPDLCLDEIRIPLYSQIFNLTTKDNGFMTKWFDKEERKYFNCINKNIKTRTIKKEIEKDGRFAFHPYRKKFTLI